MSINRVPQSQSVPDRAGADETARRAPLPPRVTQVAQYWIAQQVMPQFQGIPYGSVPSYPVGVVYQPGYPVPSFYGAPTLPLRPPPVFGGIGGYPPATVALPSSFYGVPTLVGVPYGATFAPSAGGQAAPVMQLAPIMSASRTQDQSRSQEKARPAQQSSRLPTFRELSTHHKRAKVDHTVSSREQYRQLIEGSTHYPQTEATRGESPHLPQQADGQK